MRPEDPSCGKCKRIFRRRRGDPKFRIKDNIPGIGVESDIGIKGKGTVRMDKIISERLSLKMNPLPRICRFGFKKFTSVWANVTFIALDPALLRFEVDIYIFTLTETKSVLEITRESERGDEIRIDPGISLCQRANVPLTKGGTDWLLHQGGTRERNLFRFIHMVMKCLLLRKLRGIFLGYGSIILKNSLIIDEFCAIIRVSGGFFLFTCMDEWCRIAYITQSIHVGIQLIRVVVRTVILSVVWNPVLIRIFGRLSAQEFPNPTPKVCFPFHDRENEFSIGIEGKVGMDFGIVFVFFPFTKSTTNQTNQQ